MRHLVFVSFFALWCGNGIAQDMNVSYRAGGDFAPLGKYHGIKGEAKIERTKGVGTSISVRVRGLKKGTKYRVHVHALPCSLNQAGAHYQIDPTAKAGEQNEIWMPLTSDSKGAGHAEVKISHFARPDAQAIVVYDPEATEVKMACADLNRKHRFGSYAGAFSSFAKAKGNDMNISGTAHMVTGPKGTEFKLDAEGLSTDEKYISHVHLFPCSVAEAGGHYEFDPSLKSGDEKNEIWFTIPPNQKSFKVSVMIPHIVRPDAQSVVIHQLVDGGMPKIACADLLRVER